MGLKVFFWSKIRKNRAKYNSGRGFTEDGISKILSDEVVSNKDTATAEHKLLRINGLKKFMERLKTTRERDDFKKHLRKYINLWLPDCPFEVATTNRYTIVTQEAAVHARRDIKKGETIRYLCGNLVAMTEDEEKDLDLTRRDFSIVMSSRKKTPSLFLGPARFANHDCNANSRLTTVGSDGMQIVAVKNISQDEEITVTYGEDYFGTSNCECLCRTCEINGKGAWTVSSSSTAKEQTPLSTTEDYAGPYGFRRKRKYGALSSSASATASPDPEKCRPMKRRRSSTAEHLGPSSPSPVREVSGRAYSKAMRRSALSRFSPEINTEGVGTIGAAPASASSPLPIVAVSESELKAEMKKSSDRANHIAISFLGQGASEYVQAAIEDRSVGAEPDTGDARDPFNLYDLPKTPTKTTRSSQPSADLTDVESVFEADEVDLIPTGTPSSIHTDGPANIKHIKMEDTDTPAQSSPPHAIIADFCEVKVKEESFEAPQVLESSAIEGDPRDESGSELSDLPSDEEFDDTNHCIIRKVKPRRGKRKKLAPATPIPVEPEIPKVRYPNDYVNTNLLLAEPESKWVQCKTCSRVWVQQNAYYTRRECPRCERHSKLYGYQWPKTEQLKGDAERVRDHREVHRFLDANEEEELRKKARDFGPEVGMAV